MAVTAAGKCHFVVCGGQNGNRVVRRERITTSTGTQSLHPQQKRQHLFLTLAAPPAK
ncbi:MAG: hypothetical protein U1F98_01260 [Verrucomicrobiota bacterium]